MALIHNAILRGFNSIYQQAPHVQPSDYASFIGYSLAWFHFVKSHHDDEEETLFPMVEKVIGKPGIWDETHAEHESFLGGLGKFNEYLTEVQAKPETFDGKKLVALMDGFMEPFNNHFHSEIKTIAALSEGGEYPEAATIFKDWGKGTLTKSGYTEGVPFLFLNFDRTFEEGMWKDWPPMPAIIRAAMVRIGSAWHWG
jgi:Hemerythrin HHE cation binding domain